ncbi:cyclic phosphodiesterase-like protein-domain-containing protein [Protomyces lactucae-debilis]|uniref:Cyclic phosphodiesterase-like protein-domain-containing protein n=1 Tax=Protomyces lactucae-debilis TaxID=2754530 RepID=A0A1Y2FD74_PROLT|nr:cyclic phosphodiesterase-like protein-domain-containing protein [Protomyces lactucae-debilis]ORY81374.1 cyclic phosphodiesterase-like protein-domain-containing protein [Protomyces lactucae-debilis]
MSFGGSLWLVPAKESKLEHILKQAIQLLSENGDQWGETVTSSFPPHMTITSSVSPDLMTSPSKEARAEERIAPTDLKVAQVVYGSKFFKRIYIRLERTMWLLEFVQCMRKAAVSESDAQLKDFMAAFEPHLSLAYASAFKDESQARRLLQDARIEEQLSQLDLAKELCQVVLMDTRSCDGPPSTTIPDSWFACDMPAELKEVLEMFRAQE